MKSIFITSLTMIVLYFAVLLLVYIIYVNTYLKYRDIEKLPGPSTFQLFKDLYFSQSSGGVVNYFQTLNNKYGSVVKVWMKPLKPFIITTDPEYCNKIYKNANNHYTPSFSKMTFLRNGFASTPNYSIWKKEKEIIKKAISKDYITTRLNIYDKKYDELLTMIRNGQQRIDMQAYLRKAQLEIVMCSLLDPENVHLSEEEMNQHVHDKQNYFELLLEKMNSPHMVGFVHKFTKNYKLQKTCSDNIVKFAASLFRKFKTVEEQHREKNNIVYAMIDEKLPDENIIDNINTLIEGGHHTMVFPPALSFYEMSKHPHIQHKIYNEIASTIGTDLKTKITLEHLDNMPYLHAVVKEATRMYMPVPFLDRELAQDVEIRGVKLPKGTVVMFYMPGILKSEDYYDEPLVFKPERFLKENVTIQAQKGYIGFGYGLKSCPGKRIAYASIKLLITKIIREFEISPLETDYKLEMASDIFFRTLNGIPITFKKR